MGAPLALATPPCEGYGPARGGSSGNAWMSELVRCSCSFSQAWEGGRALLGLRLGVWLCEGCAVRLGLSSTIVGGAGGLQGSLAHKAGSRAMHTCCCQGPGSEGLGLLGATPVQLQLPQG